MSFGRGKLVHGFTETSWNLAGYAQDETDYGIEQFLEPTHYRVSHKPDHDSRDSYQRRADNRAELNATQAKVLRTL